MSDLGGIVLEGNHISYGSGGGCCCGELVRAEGNAGPDNYATQTPASDS